MSEGNTTPTSPTSPTLPPASDSQQPPAEVKATEGGSESNPAAFTFSQKIELVKKKYEYMNKQGMDPVAAEAEARRNLSFPEMTVAEKEEAAKPNIFQRILKMFGITALLNRKGEDSKKKAELSSNLSAEALKENEEGLTKEDTKPAQPNQGFSSVEAPTDKSVENPAPQNPQPEVKPIENSPTEAFPSAGDLENKSEDKPPQQPQV